MHCNYITKPKWQILLTEIANYYENHTKFYQIPSTEKCESASTVNADGIYNSHCVH